MRQGARGGPRAPKAYRGSKVLFTQAPDCKPAGLSLSSIKLKVRYRPEAVAPAGVANVRSPLIADFRLISVLDRGP